MKSLFKYSLAFTAVVFIGHFSFAQFDTLNTVTKPRIGVGTGTMAYFGEIQKYQTGFSSTINRIGANLMVNAPLSKHFNAEFVATYGKVSANERTLERNLNFESRIRMASLSLQYNFQPFFKPTRSFFNPYIGIGISSFEFLSKSDLKDASGATYHYWSDGSIMNQAEDAPNPENAEPLVRDYTYETDLRAQDFDSLGRYREQAFAIPLSLGVEFHITPRVDFRLGTTLNYTFTDLIDNLSPAGEGSRKGDERNDFILYSNVGLSYDLEFFKEKEVEDFEDGEEDFLAYDQTDWDKDGVIDALDDCFETPIEALVDENGCPLDTDGDGVADYFDEEVTPAGNYVNQYGVTITEAEFLRWQEIWMDSTGKVYPFEELLTKVDYKGSRGPRVAKAKEPENKNYVVIIGKEHKNISANELHQFLGYTEFETILKGDTVYYVLGTYELIEDAVAAKSSLENDGVEIRAIGKANSLQTDFLIVNEKVIDKIEKINISEGKPLPDFSNSAPNFRVQIGSYKKPVNVDETFPNVEEVTYAKGQDGLIRYYSGIYDSYRDAKKASDELKRNGVTENFVVAYKNKERITLKEAKVLLLPKDYDENKEINTFVEPRETSPKATTDETPKINPADVKYQVLLGQFTGDVPIEMIEKFLSIGGIQPSKDSEGVTSYYSKRVFTLREAEKLVKEYERYELEKISIMVYYKGAYLTLEEFEKRKQ